MEGRVGQGPERARVIIGIAKETISGERRVALVANTVKKLAEQGVKIHVETGAGAASGVSDASYEAEGAVIEPDAASLFACADLVVKVQPPTVSECNLVPEGKGILSMLFPFQNTEQVQQLRQRNVTSFAMELMPRITRAQSMDVLSSMSTISGYKAVLIAALALPKFFPMLMTAAGTIKPARVLVLGAGVAGLQAIATARRLGAVVEAFDIRSATKEQVESLGARFVSLESGEDQETEGGYAKEQTAEQQAAQRALLTKHIAAADVVITTALVPGKRAPMLLAEDQVKGMAPGSIVIDMAAEQGGNCELTKPGEIVDVNGVQVHGPANLPATTPVDASAMFARNVCTYLTHLLNEGELNLDFEDELVSGVIVTHQGAIKHEAVRTALEG